MQMSKSILSLFVFFMAFQIQAKPWKDHLEDISDLERNIYKFQQELDVLVERKKNTRERARIEQTLQRIVEIHAELISLRKNMDNTREHLKVEHPEKAHILDDYDSRMFGRKNKSSSSSKLGAHLDDLLLKVQLKYSSFLLNQEKEEVAEVEKVIMQKHKQKKEREADLYLRKRSKVRLVE